MWNGDTASIIEHHSVRIICGVSPTTQRTSWSKNWDTRTINLPFLYTTVEGTLNLDLGCWNEVLRKTPGFKVRSDRMVKTTEITNIIKVPIFWDVTSRNLVQLSWKQRQNVPSKRRHSPRRIPHNGYRICHRRERCNSHARFIGCTPQVILGQLNEGE